MLSGKVVEFSVIVYVMLCIVYVCVVSQETWGQNLVLSRYSGEQKEFESDCTELCNCTQQNVCLILSQTVILKNE